MSPSCFPRVRLSKLTLISISIVFVAVALVWAIGQPAGASASNVRTSLSSAGLFVTDKGGITSEAVTITVNSTADVANGSDGLCTLREAITAANTGTASGATPGECNAGSGSKTINFSVTGTITLTSVLDNLSTNISIAGPGANQLTISGNNARRLFQVNSSVVVNISDITLANGNGACCQEIDGGAINNKGTLTLTRVNLFGNTASGNGGAIYNSGPTTGVSLTLDSCVIGGPGAGQANISNGNGGGLYNITGHVIVNNTTFSNNSTPNSGGGIMVANGAESVANITNSTISGNTANAGSGIYNDAAAEIYNSTISGNHTGNGIENTAGAFRLVNCTVTLNDGMGVNSTYAGVNLIINTIIAGNGGTIDASGNFLSDGGNLIGKDNGGHGFVNGSKGDQVGSIASPLDPHLGPLADNGGPTKTHALLSNSTAIDAGKNCVDPEELAPCDIPTPLLTDQRGTNFNRKVDGPDGDTTATVDIGAYEMQTPLASLPDTSTNEDTQLTVIFDGGDPSTISSVTVTSSNATLVPNDPAHLSVTMTGTTGLITINPATNENGTTNITVTINRTVGGPDVKTFILTVNLVNDAPSFTKGADQTVFEDASAQTVSHWATSVSPGGSSDESGQILTFQIANNSNAALFSVAPAISSDGTLTYTPAANANGSSTITINLKDNGGTANSGSDTSASQTFTITVNAVNDPPSFTKGADQTVIEDSGAQTVTNWATAISRGPADESGQTLTFQVTNNTNAPLFSAGPAVSSTGTLTYTPAANANGSATIAVNLKDSGDTANGGIDTSASQTFTITVNAINDAPSFTKGANQTVNEDAGAQTVNNWATNISSGPSDESGQTVGFNVTGNTNVGLFSAGPAVSSSGTLTYTPAANANGSATITLTAQDNGGTANGGLDTSASQTFTISVNAVNDAPSFTKGVDQTVNEDAGAQTVSNWATSRSAGPADESGQTLSFQITSNTTASLFSAGPAVSSTGTLTYTPASNANGSATISVVIKDNGGTTNGGVDTSAAQTFTITVNAVNDAPSFTKGANQTVNEDAGAQAVNSWASSISPGPADESGQTVSFNITGNTNAALFSAGPAVSSTGTLSYTPAANANGSATVTLVIKDDGGTASGGVDTSASQTFTISVNAVNDVPSFTKGVDQTLNNNAGAQTVANWATNISAGPANESGQTLTFQITGNTNTGLFTASPAVSSTGTLTYTPSSSGGGTATITINLKDNGGTLNGGVDTSASQTFTITVTPVGGFVNFASSTGNTTENSGSTTVNVTRSGDTSKAVTVNYATNADAGVPCSTANGVASPKCDFTTALGTLNFAVGETTKPITILISQDSFVEGPETIMLTLSSPTGGAALGTPATMSVTIADDATEPPTNIIDDANMFVRMHYHDFLNREADQSGLDFWTGQMTNCGNSDLTVCRVNVSGAFFLSIEFQQTGYLVERMYKTAYGDATGTSTIGGSHQIFVPVVRANEFLTDTQRIGRGVVVLQSGWEQVLENNKQAYALEFVQTSRFTTALPTTMTPAQFVDKLNINAGNVLSASERTTAINLFGNAADTTNTNARGQALRQVAEDTDLYNAEFNRAFVLSEYIGYLRRNPNDAPESTLDYTGYDFWLAKLNENGGDYIKAEMVKAFISSSEYRQRFGP